MFEYDDISLEEQKEIYKKQKDIISYCVFSGNKSIHFYIQIKPPYPQNKDEYKYVWGEIYKKYFNGSDKQDYLPNKWGRTDNAIRKETGKKQILIKNELTPLDINWKETYNAIQEIKNRNEPIMNLLQIKRRNYYNSKKYILF
jgi:hypothetical protein